MALNSKSMFLKKILPNSLLCNTALTHSFRNLSFLAFGILFSLSTVAQPADAENGLVKWMKLEDAMRAYEQQPKPLIVDFYTDWCGWCKHMIKTTYSNPGLAAYINQNFYPVKFDAEGKDTITYLGQKYGPLGVGQRTTHALAAKLLQNKMVYPTTLFLNNLDKQKNDFTLSLLASGYLDEKKIEPLLVFSLENVFRNSTYDEFNENFQKAFFDSLSKVKFEKLKWANPKETFEKKTPDTKKTIVFINTDWCNSCKVMKRTTFIHDSSAAYINSKYQLVDFNPEITDVISFKGNTFSNPQNPQFPFHQLAQAITRNNFVLPTLAILDEEMNLIDAIPYYINPSFINDICRFYGDNIYKQKNWADYMSQKAVQK